MNNLEMLSVAREGIVGLIITIVVIIVYMIIYFLAQKYGHAKLPCKTANIIGALFVWEEAVFGNLYKMFGLNELQYLLIIGAVLALLNSMLND